MKLSNGFSERLATLALAQVGKREIGNNGGPDVRSYQRATWLEPGQWPWCAAFVCWCMQRAANVDEPCRLPATPRATQLLEWGEKYGFHISKSSALLKRGDVVVFKFKSGHHCGIAVDGVSDGLFPCVEGNTDGSGGREGDGVYLRSRSMKHVLGIIHF